MLELTPDSAAGYLRDRGTIGPSEQVHIRELSGGVSNTVLLVHRPEVPGSDFVLKQALPRLKVQQEWLCSIERIWREVAVIEICRSLLFQSPQTTLNPREELTVPFVIFTDRENYCFAMTAAPAGHNTWKEILLAGDANSATATACGWLLGSLHAESWQRPDLAKELEDRSFFDALRLDPYYRRVAEVHPDLSAIVTDLVDETYATRLALVHGDFSPKNLLIAGSEIWLIDFEVGHFGDPAFDLGFFLTHLALKAVHLANSDDCLQLIDGFWRAYQLRLSFMVSVGEETDLARRSALHWAACMLARVDGKSPVDYLTRSEQHLVRTLARGLLLHPLPTVPEVLRTLRDSIGNTSATKDKME